MTFDVVLVTYNSSKWLKNNVESIAKSDYDLKNISLYYYDNASSDDTVAELEKIKTQYAQNFANFKIIKANKNKGFGYGNNRAAKLGKSEYIFFLNIDTEVKADTFSVLEQKINQLKNEFQVFELRQEPYEHPKYYDPVNGQVSWASGACLIFERSLFESLHGFDENMFMYCEDVEISWRVRQAGHKIRYLYDVGIIHYTYTEKNDFKVLAYIYGKTNQLYLRCKYGTFRNSGRGFLILLGAIRNNYTPLSNDEYKTVSKKIVKVFFKMFFSYIAARVYKHTHKNKGDFKPNFIEWCYEAQKVNTFKEQNNEKIKDEILISVLIRTCGRSNVLREALISLRNQSYKNIEIVIVEDGQDTTSDMIRQEFSDLNIVYKATGNHVGRSKVGNIAMEMASGKYLNFLDDDDAFYFDHIEVLAKQAVNHNYDIVYDTAFETRINVLSENPYKYKTENVIPFITHNPNNILPLYRTNLFPIQTVMFKKDVFLNCGGFDETIEFLEDWDLWLKFSLKYDFHYVNDTTSVFRTPANPQNFNERAEIMNQTFDIVKTRYKDEKITLSIKDLQAILG